MDIRTQAEKAEQFRNYITGEITFLPNAWDVASARFWKKRAPGHCDD